MEYRFTRKHYCFWVLIHVVFVGVLESCLEEERLGLLSIKDYFKLNGGNENPWYTNEAFASWTDDPVADCCSWERVKCNNATTVTQLSLDDLLPSMTGSQRVLLNMSLFTPFKELLSLNLSRNGFTECYQNHDFKALNNLVALDLSSNNFSGNIQPCLSTLTSLQSLYLSDGFWYYANLSIPDLRGLKKLKILDLNDNGFSGNVFHSLGNMTSLEALSLARNNLNGSFAQQGICELKNLQELSLGDNNLSGSIPACLGNLTSFKILDLSFNRVEGNISSNPIFKLKDIKFINLRENPFEGLFSFYSIANHTNFEVLMLSSPNHKLEVQTQYSRDWLPTFQLKFLVLSNCKLYNIPQFLAHQTDLRVVDLSHNNLTGTFPNWLLENNTKLRFLSLRNNNFTGQFHLSSNSSFVAYVIDISDNHLQGELQPDIGTLFSKAGVLNLSANAFEGRIPFSIGHMPELSFLDLSNNRFSGEIATTLGASDNKLDGHIPNFINMTSLLILQLSGNQIMGNLPSWISHHPSLGFLDLSDNHITGEIPSEITSPNLSHLDLSHNFLSGQFPSCFNLSQCRHFNLEGNRLTGSIPETLLNSSSLETLNIGNNLMSGCIPSSVGALSELRVLLLGRNSLGGLIPNQLCQLNQLAILDLSHNLFLGPIPRCLGNISFGKLTLSDFAYEGVGVFLVYQDNFGEKGFKYHAFDPSLDFLVVFMQQLRIEFVIKKTRRVYEGKILDLMSGLDLSCNQLIGKIPTELGTLSSLHALNLSHNQLTNIIPTTFAKLGQIESLDLSHNKLSGKIPSTLLRLNFLSCFSVAYNNLSGRLPDMDEQFQTFDNKSYEGNPFLCGPPLPSCDVIHDVPQLAPSNTDASEEKWYDIDPVFFIASFIASYLVFLVAFALVLYVNPGWRRRLFLFIDYLMDECYFLIFYTVSKLFAAFYR